MMKYVYISIGILFYNLNSFGQLNDVNSDLEQQGIKRKVEIIEEFHYLIKKKPEKDSLDHIFYSVYSEDGFILEKGKINIISGERTPIDTYKLKYNTRNQIEGKYKNSCNDSLIPIALFKYDSLNRAIETIRYYRYIRGCSQMESVLVNDGGDIIKKRTYTYNKKGIYKYDVWGLDSSGNWKLQGTYNIDNMSMINKTSTKKRREYYLRNRTQYIVYDNFDEFGNWLHYTEYYKKSLISRLPITRVERKIKYNQN
jgi:hypothetical protein